MQKYANMLGNKSEKKKKKQEEKSRWKDNSNDITESKNRRSFVYKEQRSLILPMQLITCEFVGRASGEANLHFKLIFVNQFFISVATKKLGFYSQQSKS